MLLATRFKYELWGSAAFCVGPWLWKLATKTPRNS